MITVETSSRWETSSLLRKLRGEDVYAIQVGRAHWLVRSSRPRSAADVEAVEILLAEWARDEGMPLPTVHVGETFTVIPR